jgi:asparagine synthase (glutamine-hydrolysing)
MSALTPVELATGIVFGSVPRPLPSAQGIAPADALEAAVRVAVRTERCFVSFSGGRDSSAVLAAAAAVARREGLPLPVPLTIRAHDAPLSDESEFQESVVRHLGLGDWIRIDIRDELDAVGPYARQAMSRHGLLWPFNAHFHSPMLEQAAGGTLLTGVGGDELWTSSTASHVGLRRRALQLAPRVLRREVLARRAPVEFPWLRAAGARAVRRVNGDDAATLPRTVSERMAQVRGVRYTATGCAALDLLASDAGAEIAHPLLDLGLWAAVAGVAPRDGFERPREALARVAGRLLPTELISRRTKASFDAVFFNAHARAFAQDWMGGGIPAALVDAAALRAHWLDDQPDPHSLTLMQSAWLSSAGDRVDEPLRHVRQ